MMEWSTPPARPDPSEGKWATIERQLRERPGQWALVGQAWPHYPGVPKRFIYNKTLWDVQRVTEGNVRRTYVRYIGD